MSNIFKISVRTTAEENRMKREEERAATKLPSTTILYDSDDLTRNPRHTWTPKDDEYLGEDVYLWVYSGIVVAVFVLTKFRAIYFFMFCIKISINVHNRMFVSLVRAPMKFFDENPSGNYKHFTVKNISLEILLNILFYFFIIFIGRVMNRFTKDLGAMDELLPYSFFDAVTIFLLMVSMVILIIIANYYMAIPTGLLLIGLFSLRAYFIRTARDVKRIEAICKEIRNVSQYFNVSHLV